MLGSAEEGSHEVLLLPGAAAHAVSVAQASFAAIQSAVWLR
jgi:hypothetical protein